MIKTQYFCDRCKKDMGGDEFKRTDMTVPIPPKNDLCFGMWTWKHKKLELCCDCHDRLLEFLGVKEP